MRRVARIRPSHERVDGDFNEEDWQTDRSGSAGLHGAAGGATQHPG